MTFGDGGSRRVERHTAEPAADFDPVAEIPDYHAFEADELGGGPGRLMYALGLPLRLAVGAWSILARPFEYLTALRHAFSGARMVQSPDRRIADLIQAVPALTVVLAASGVAVGATIQRMSLAAEYRRIAATAFEQEDHAAVRVYSGRTYDLGGGAQALYRVATAHARLGNVGGAEREMRRLAVEAGYGPASLWLADRLLADPRTYQDPERLGEAASRLRNAEQAGADPDEVAKKMARVLAAGGDLAAAVPYLERVAADDPSVSAELATAYTRLGRREDARRVTSAADEELRRKVERSPGDVDARARWVTGLLNLGRTQEALAGLNGASKEGVLGDLFVIACLAREREMTKAGAPAAERLALVREALEVRPRSDAVLLRLVEMARNASYASASGEADQLLAEALAAGPPPSAVSVALGLRAWDSGDPQRALARFEEAYAADPSNTVAANNYAWMLTRQPSPDLERAFEVADRLVRKHPEGAQFRDTRGQILARLGRWDEALVDLERALAVMRDSVDTRRTLAEAYRRAGQERLADLQDQEADRLEAKEAATPP